MVWSDHRWSGCAAGTGFASAARCLAILGEIYTLVGLN